MEKDKSIVDSFKGVIFLRKEDDRAETIDLTIEKMEGFEQTNNVKSIMNNLRSPRENNNSELGEMRDFSERTTNILYI